MKILKDILIFIIALPIYILIKLFVAFLFIIAISYMIGLLFNRNYLVSAYMIHIIKQKKQ